MLNNLTITIYHATNLQLWNISSEERIQIIGEVHLNLARFWFAISFAVSFLENHFIPKFWNYCIAKFDVIYRRSKRHHQNFVYETQIISLRRKVDCDWTAPEHDCISAQELKKNKLRGTMHLTNIYSLKRHKNWWTVNFIAVFRTLLNI